MVSYGVDSDRYIHVCCPYICPSVLTFQKQVKHNNCHCQLSIVLLSFWPSGSLTSLFCMLCCNRGEAMNGGFGLVLDGTPEAAEKASKMLNWDVSNGVARRFVLRNDVIGRVANAPQTEAPL